MKEQPRDALVDLELPSEGAYPLPEVVERPHQPPDGIHEPEKLADRSLSRAVDRDAAGAPVLDAGYDRSIEGESPGALDPDRESQPDDEAPAGEWGSS